MKTHWQTIPLILAICSCAELLNAGSVSYFQEPLAEGKNFWSTPSGEQRADNFSFAQKTKVTTIRWWGTYLNNPPSGPDSFRIRFFAPDPLAGGAPQNQPTDQFTSLTITRTNSGLFDSFGDSIYQYESQLSTPVIFSAGETAYFSVVNGLPEPQRWYWQVSSNAGSNWFRLDEEPESIWFPGTGGNAGNLAFQLIGVTPPQGDYNSDFTVNHTDYNQWRGSFGSSSAPLAADGNLNGVVDTADYVVWRKNFGTSSGSGGGLAAVVPEPSAHVLPLTGALLLGFVLRARTWSLDLHSGSP